MNDLINYDGEPLYSSTNEENNKMAVLNTMDNIEAEKVKYEGMYDFMKVKHHKNTKGSLKKKHPKNWETALWGKERLY